MKTIKQDLQKKNDEIVILNQKIKNLTENQDTEQMELQNKVTAYELERDEMQQTIKKLQLDIVKLKTRLEESDTDKDEFDFFTIEIL